MSTFESSSVAQLPPVARHLIESNHLSQKQANEVLLKTQKNHTSYIAELIASKQIDYNALAQVVSELFSLPQIEIDALDLTKIPKDKIEPKLMREHQILPLSIRGNALVVATADPTLSEVQDRIKFATRLSVDWVIADAEKLKNAVTNACKTLTESLSGITQGGDFDFHDANDPTEATQEKEGASMGDAESDADDAPVVKFLHKMLLDAIEMGASDLHFEPYEFIYRVRFRVDGELREIVQPPLAIKDKLASRIKVISRMDISEKRVPQDGRMKLRVSPERVIDFRVSSLPTLFGEKIVVRILDPSSATLGIEALGYEEEEKTRLLHAISRPYGMVLVTGPTGSGKTVSLYTCLNLLNKPERNISTAEDPVEINMMGINQVSVNEKAGLTFAAALKAFLRQDPDIIMVGEIRDLETADISIKAAQTGHLVLSTLHTNDAPTTLTRLRNMGVAPFNIASSVLLITAQRLGRRLCSKCKKPVNLPRQTLVEAGFKPQDLDGSWQPYGPVGCPECNKGYKGRVGIYQVMPITEEIQRIILADGTSLQIAEQAQKEGVKDLRQSALRKVKAGVTSLEEIEAITNV
ncbi:MAG: type IV-A pilus assembly ATPase PilB [Saezia sp.]